MHERKVARWYGPPLPFLLLARLAEIPEGAMVLRTHGAHQVLLARVRGEVLAIDDVCPHAGAPLHEGSLSLGEPGGAGAGECMVTCPWHEAHFDLRTGRVDQDTPWAVDTRAYRVELRGDEVWVEL